MPFTERPLQSVTWDDRDGVPYVKLVDRDGEVRVWTWDLDNKTWAEKE